MALGASSDLRVMYHDELHVLIAQVSSVQLQRFDEDFLIRSRQAVIKPFKMLKVIDVS